MYVCVWVCVAGNCHVDRGWYPAKNFVQLRRLLKEQIALWIRQGNFGASEKLLQARACFVVYRPSVCMIWLSRAGGFMFNEWVSVPFFFLCFFIFIFIFL